MKLLFTFIFICVNFRAGAQELEKPKGANDPQHVFCEFELTSHEQLMAVTRQIHSMLTGKRFRVVTHSSMPSLLRVYKMNRIENLDQVTAEVTESEEGYRMYFYDKYNIEIANMFFDFPPVKAWPLYSADKNTFDYHFENDDVVFPYTKGEPLPDGMAIGVILDEQNGDRMYLATHKLNDQIYIHLGVDIGENQRYSKPGPIPQRFLHTQNGWLRRTHILSLMFEPPRFRPN